MPKLSFAQTVVELRETFAAVRSLAGVLPKLALKVADDLEAQVATIQELKSRQRTYVAELKNVAEAKQAAIARGKVTARDIRLAPFSCTGRGAPGSANFKSGSSAGRAAGRRTLRRSRRSRPRTRETGPRTGTPRA